MTRKPLTEAEGTPIQEMITSDSDGSEWTEESFAQTRPFAEIHELIAVPADPNDLEDFDRPLEILDRGERARLIWRTRARLGLSRSEFAERFHFCKATLRDWEKAQAFAPDFAIAYFLVIARYPAMVEEAVA